MNMSVRKRITTNKPVKAWKIVTQKVETGDWLTGYFCAMPLVPGEWVAAGLLSPGFHAFKSRGGATDALYFLVRMGRIKHPSYIVPCYLRGTVEFGLYLQGAFKAIRGSQMLIKEKHMPRGLHD